jgi:hypothetical protein
MNDISVAELQAALISIDPGEDLCLKVRALEDNGLTLAQAIIKIADDQGPSRKPASKAEPPSEYRQNRGERAG